MFCLKEIDSFYGESLYAPPLTNRGVQNTTENGLRACVDWVQVTFKNVNDPYVICDLLYLERCKFKVYETGLFGYKSHIRYSNIAIYYDGSTENNVHLYMSGQGCREFENISPLNWSELFAMILEYFDVNITRLDIAIDDFKGYFTVNQLQNKVKRGHVTSRFKESIEMNKIKISDGTNTGETLYFGKQSSDMMVRFYNKKLERQSNDKDKVVIVDTWVRTELQLRRKRAQRFAEIIAYSSDSIGSIASGVLRNYIRFLVPDKNDSNKSRWKTAPFWDKFLGDTEKIKLTMNSPDYTIEKAKNWLKHSVAPTLYTVFEAIDWDMELLLELFNDGKERINDKQKNAIQQYRIAKEKENEFKKDKLHKERIKGLQSGKFIVNENGQITFKPKKLDQFDFIIQKMKQKEKLNSYKSVLEE